MESPEFGADRRFDPESLEGQALRYLIDGPKRITNYSVLGTGAALVNYLSSQDHNISNYYDLLPSNLPLPETDVAVSYFYPNQLDKNRSLKFLGDVQASTGHGGLNIIKVICERHPGIAELNQQYIFSRAELRGIYTEAGWQILHYESGHVENLDVQIGGGSGEVAGIIARNTSLVHDEIGALARYVRGMDPELDELARGYGF